MYQNTKLFWVNIVAVAILSMFHYSVTANDDDKPRCSPKFAVDNTNRFRPIWSWESGSELKECNYQLDDGNGKEKDNCSFQPPNKLSIGVHKLKIIFTCSQDNKGQFEAKYDTETGKMTDEKYTNGSQVGSPSTPAGSQVGSPSTPAGSQVDSPSAPAGNQVDSPSTPANGQGTIVPPIPNPNACDDKPPRKFTMSGKIVDANSGQGISGAKLVVLVPNTLIYEYDAFLDSSSIISQAVTDESGNYTLSRRLRNGRKYSMFINADGYKRYKSDEQLMESCNKNLNKEFKLQPTTTNTGDYNV